MDDHEWQAGLRCLYPYVKIKYGCQFKEMSLRTSVLSILYLYYELEFGLTFTIVHNIIFNFSSRCIVILADLFST